MNLYVGASLETEEDGDEKIEAEEVSAELDGAAHETKNNGKRKAKRFIFD